LYEVEFICACAIHWLPRAFSMSMALVVDRAGAAKYAHANKYLT
jgi:hypothetical protein